MNGGKENTASLNVETLERLTLKETASLERLTIFYLNFQERNTASLYVGTFEKVVNV
jgi:hypothetical protein